MSSTEGVCNGNLKFRWSKIAQHLPGRTDNEIKNYWRTRVQKQAKQLQCDVNSKKFKDTMQFVWMPRLMEQIRAESGSSSSSPAQAVTTDTTVSNTSTYPSEANSGSTESGSELIDAFVAEGVDSSGWWTEELGDGFLNFEQGNWSDVNIWELI